MTKITVWAAAICLLFTLPLVANAAPINVNLELALGVDVSGSVNDSEYNLQKTGYVNAFNNIASFGSFEPFAVTYYEWSGSTEQAQLVDWTLISSVADAQSFAAMLESVTRAFDGSTGIASAMDFGVGLFENEYEGAQKIIDISGDGEENDGGDVDAARSGAENLDVVINGLPIGSVADYYLNNIITSDGFIEPADTFEDFEFSISQKLAREITQEVRRENIPTPEPGTVVLLLVGLTAIMVPMKFRKKL